MYQQHSFPRWLSHAPAALSAFVLLLGLVALPDDARADGYSLDCSGNDYVSQVQVTPFSNGQFEISVTPTDNARWAELGGNPLDDNSYEAEATNEIWHAVQACVPGLYGVLADGIYEQIYCHVLGTFSGPFHAGGATFDFESWRQPVSLGEAFTNECNWGGWPYTPVGDPYRPDLLANAPTY